MTPYRSSLAAVLALATLTGCGQAIAPLAAPRDAQGLVARMADATPREIARLLDHDGDGLVQELEGWVSGKAGAEAFCNFSRGGQPGRPVPTAVVERALGLAGELVIHGMAGGAGSDGLGAGLTSAARTRLAAGVAKILAADPASAGGRIPARVVKVHRFIRSDEDGVTTFTPGALQAEVARLLEERTLDARVKLTAGEAKGGIRHRLVLTAVSTF